MNSITISGQDNSVLQTVHVCWQLTGDSITMAVDQWSAVTQWHFTAKMDH